MWVYRETGKQYDKHVEGKAVFKNYYAIGYYILAENEQGNVVSHFVQTAIKENEGDARALVNYLNGGNTNSKI